MLDINFLKFNKKLPLIFIEKMPMECIYYLVFDPSFNFLLVNKITI